MTMKTSREQLRELVARTDPKRIPLDRIRFGMRAIAVIPLLSYNDCDAIYNEVHSKT